MSNHNDKELSEKIQTVLQISDTPKVNSLWKHYKGGIYIIQGLCLSENDENIHILYSSTTNPLPIPWSRSIKDWHSQIYKDGKLIPRFELVPIEYRE
jgi:hypothetical protein